MAIPQEHLPQSGELVLLYVQCGCGCGEMINVQQDYWIHAHADKAYYVDRLCMAKAHNAEYFPLKGRVRLDDGTTVSIDWFMHELDVEENDYDFPA